MAAIKINLTAIVDLQPCLTGNRLKKNSTFLSLNNEITRLTSETNGKAALLFRSCMQSFFIFSIPRWNFTYDHHPWSRENPASNEKSGFPWKLPNLSKENGKRRVHVLVLNYKIQDINLTICIKYHRIIYF